jgi:carboxypeptidase family protein
MRALPVPLPMFGIAAAAICLASCGDETPVAPSAPTPSALIVTGSVQDTVSRALSGATVEIIDGPTAGRSTTTGGDGRFSLSPTTSASGSFTFQVAKEGYFPTTVRLPARAEAERNVGSITLIALDLLDLAGTYTATFMADSSCSQLPNLARSRTYTARAVPATPNRTRFEITLSDASFLESDTVGPANRFFVDVANDFAMFHVYSGFSGSVDLPVVEELVPAQYVAFAGTARSSVGKSDVIITAPLNGSISYCASPTPPTVEDFTCPVAKIECRSPTHRLIIRR